MTAPVRNEKTYTFTGGIISDNPLVGRECADIENLVAPFGGGDGLEPRNGIEPIVQLIPTPTEGMTAHLIRLTGNPIRRLVAIQNARTKKIVHISNYTEQFGRLLPQIATGGTDNPIGQNPPDSSDISDGGVDCTVAFGASSYEADLGDSITATIVRTGDASSTVFVTYSSAYDPGSSPTDWDAASGILIFEPGDTSKDITVQSHDVGQLITKGGTLDICQALSDNPANTVTIGEPSEATIAFTVTYAPTAWARPSNLATAVPVMMFLKGAGTFASHYLDGFTGSSGTAPTSSYISRVGKDTICYLTVFGATCYSSLYSIAQMATDGPAYSLGATSKSAAIKTQPYAVSLVCSSVVSTTQSGYILDQFKWAAYSDSHFVFVTSTEICMIALSDGSVSKHGFSSSHSGSFDGFGIVGGSDAANQCFVGSDGYISINLFGFTL